jgi:hypothetical protein
MITYISIYIYIIIIYTVYIIIYIYTYIQTHKDTHTDSDAYAHNLYPFWWSDLLLPAGHLASGYVPPFDIPIVQLPGTRLQNLIEELA